MIRFKRREDISPQDVARLYESGLTTVEIAERLATCKTLVLARLDEAGIDRRPQGAKRPESRFWRKVNKNGPIPIHAAHLGQCWEWQGATARGKHPYGKFFLHGKRVHAHRFAYELQHGSIPDQLCVCHACDNEKCCRPSHLWLGTCADNNRDRDSKGRQAHGERMGAAKLSYQEADTIRWSYEVGGLNIVTLARWYEVGETTIGNIIHNRTWKRPADRALAA